MCLYQKFQIINIIISIIAVIFIIIICLLRAISLHVGSTLETTVIMNSVKKSRFCHSVILHYNCSTDACSIYNVRHMIWSGHLSTPKWPTMHTHCAKSCSLSNPMWSLQQQIQQNWLIIRSTVTLAVRWKDSASTHRHNDNNNNNTNNHSMFAVPHHDEATATVHPVPLTDVERCAETKSNDTSHKSTCRLLMFTLTITIRSYCWSQKCCTDMLVLLRKLRRSKLPQEYESCWGP